MNNKTALSHNDVQHIDTFESVPDAGWNGYFQSAFDCKKTDGETAARVINRQKGNYRIYAQGLVNGARLSGKFLHATLTNTDYPVVGDWVAVRNFECPNSAVITRLLPRQNFFARKQAISGGRKIRNGIVTGGATEEQVIAANIDIIFIVTGLDANYNAGRLERYLTLAKESSSKAVIILNKADLCDNSDPFVRETSTIAGGCDFHKVSAVSGENMRIFDSYLRPGNTVVFLGSSGVGKSTLINRLFSGISLKTQSVSEVSGKGRHTTTWSDLIFHPSGAMLIDTPGTRELQLWAESDSVDSAFGDITELSRLCRFKNCSHNGEPGCAVQCAIEQGTLSAERLERYFKQHTEIDLLSLRKEQYARYRSRRSRQ